MGQPNDADADDRQQANSITDGAPQAYSNGGYQTIDAVTLYLIKQGAPPEQATALADSLRHGAPDDLGIQGSATADVAGREVDRMRALSRYLELERRAAACGAVDKGDQAFMAAVRDRHRQLIQQRAIMAQAQQQNRQWSMAQAQASERTKMNNLEGQQLERLGQREQERLSHMQSYAMQPQNRALSKDGMHSTFIPEDQVQHSGMDGELASREQVLHQKLFGQAKTAAALAQQFGIPPDAAAQLAGQLHEMPTQPAQPSTGGPVDHLRLGLGPIGVTF